MFRYFKYTKPPKKSTNNMKKLFTVLGTLAGITLLAVLLVILWYRLKATYKRRKKQKKILEQQRHFSSSRAQPSTSHSITVPRYASSDMISSLPGSSQAITTKSQSQVLIEPKPLVSTVYKNDDALTSNPTEILFDRDDENNHQGSIKEEQATDIQATTQF